MTGQVAEHVAAEIAGDADEGETRVQLATRHSKLSAAISDMSNANASHTLPACD